MKIAFVLDCFGGGGKERRCLRLIQGLNARKITEIIVIIINNNIKYTDIYKTTAKIHVLDRKKDGTLTTYNNFRKIITDFNPENIQVFGAYLSSLYVDCYCLFHKFNYISSYVADCYPPKTILERIIHKLNIKFANYIVGNSQAGIKAYKIPSMKAKVIYNGYEFKENIQKPSKMILKRKLNFKENFVISMVATMSPKKDYDTYLACAKEIIKERNDILFLCIGDGIPSVIQHYTNSLTAFERKKINILGFRSDVEDILSITDISVLCTYSEGISNSVIEAMAIGIPVLVTDGGGTNEIIKHGHNGYLLEQKNPNDLKQHIYKLLDEMEEMDTLKKNARLTIKNDFNLDKMVDAYIAIYR